MGSDRRPVAAPFSGPFSGSLADVGTRESIFGPRLVGFMRRLGLSAALATSAGLLGLGYAHLEARSPTLRRFRVAVPARGDLAPLRILHVSDLHMFPGQTFIENFLAKVAAEEEFDLVVSTGDNFGDMHSLDLLLDAYQPLLAFPGAFVLGSNDYYSPMTKSWLTYFRHPHRRRVPQKHRRNQPDLPWLTLVREFERAGWVDVSNRTETLHLAATAGRAQDRQTVALAGVDDPHIRRDRVPSPSATWENPNSWRLALSHAPYLRVIDAFEEQGADLILAGHTHGGQVCVPGIGSLVTNSDIPRRYSRGLHRWPATPGAPSLEAEAGEKGPPTFLHVSAGLGTSPYAPIRFSCRPEASLIELVPE